MKIVNPESVSSQDELIAKFVKENDIELMHIRLFLSARGYVVMTEDEYEDNTNN